MRLFTRKCFIYLLAFILSLGVSPVPAQTIAPAGENTAAIPDEAHVVLDDATGLGYIDNVIVLLLRKGVDDKEALSWFPGENARVIGRFPSVNQVQIQIAPRSKDKLDALCESLMAKEQVLYAHGELAASTAGPVNSEPAEPDEDFTLQQDPPSQVKPTDAWWYEAIKLKPAQQLFPSLDYVSVGVVDDGFDTSHPDLRLVFPNKMQQERNWPESHGTHVAGIIQQMMPGAAITVVDSYRIADLDPMAHINTQSQFLKNLLDMVDAQVKVINFSMGSDIQDDNMLPWNRESATIFSVYIWLLKQAGNDFLLVQSAGNTAIDSRRNGMFAMIDVDNCLGSKTVQDSLSVGGKLAQAQQSVFDSIVVVAACEKKDAKGQYPLALDSNHGPGITVAAPGDDIVSTVPGGYKSIGGTSQAAPIASAALALIWSVNKGLTAGQVKQMLVDSATDSVPDLIPDRPGNRRLHYPLVNVLEALRKASTS